MGAHFKALIVVVFMVPLNSRFTQVRFNLIFVQVWNTVDSFDFVCLSRMHVRKLMADLFLPLMIPIRFMRSFSHYGTQIVSNNDQTLKLKMYSIDDLYLRVDRNDCYDTLKSLLLSSQPRARAFTRHIEV